MRIWMLSVITTMGLIMGMILARVGGLSAMTGLAPHSENTKKIEKYWLGTGLGFQDVLQLVANDKCYSSEKYYTACLNALIENSLSYGLKLSTDGSELVKMNKFEKLDEKTEKELLHLYLTSYLQSFPRKIDFNKIVMQLMSLETESQKAFLAAQMINAFLSVYSDPHTYIMPADYYEEVGSKLKRAKNFVGISYEKKNDVFYIRKVYKNSDAEIAGLKMNDRILAINATNLADASFSDLSQILKNENLSVLKFKIGRLEKKEIKILSVDLKRSYRQLSHVQYNTLSADGNFGLITLTKFNDGACSQIAEILTGLDKNKIEGLVLDLRDNPGGQLNEAACIAGLFLGKNKKAYYVEYFDEKKPNEVVLTSEELVYQGPLAVLVNESSASASELLAGGLQDYNRAVIVGQKTFGKGTFQEPEEWISNAKVSLYKTQGLYLLPSRNATQLEGVQPDIELASEKTALKQREADIYFSPLAAATKKYAKIKSYESKEKNFRYKSCKRANFFTSEDLYLQKSLNYLSCVRQIDSSIAQSEVEAQTN